MESGIEYYFKLAEIGSKVQFDDESEALVMDWPKLNKIHAAEDNSGIIYNGNKMGNDMESYAVFTFRWRHGSLAAEEKIAVKL
jgi:hypothetical protein